MFVLCIVKRRGFRRVGRTLKGHGVIRKGKSLKHGEVPPCGSGLCTQYKKQPVRTSDDQKNQ